MSYVACSYAQPRGGASPSQLRTCNGIKNSEQVRAIYNLINDQVVISVCLFPVTDFLVRHEDSNGTTTLTGVGYLNSSERIVAPQDREHSYRSVESSLDSFAPLRDAGFWTFVFHAGCWAVLCERVLDDTSTPSLISDVLFNILHCTPRDKYKYFRPGHDFGGAARFQQPVSNPLRSMSKEGLDYFLTEPTKFASVEEPIFRWASSNAKATQRVTSAAVTRVQATPTARSRDIFSNLPFEVLCLLLTLLPSHNIKQLRLASRTVACISSTSLQLPQSFWRSRFAPGFEMDFALPSDADRGPHDWRALYSAIKHELLNPHGSPRLRNRKRVWELVGKNAALFSMRRRSVQLHGTSVSGNLANRNISGDVIRTEFTDRHSDTLYVGSRRIFVRSLLTQPTKQIMYAVGVSTTVFNSRVFISGLRIFWDNSIPKGPSHSLGYVMKDSETLLHIQDPKDLDGFELAACVDGIVGLRVMSKSGFHSSWAGNIGHGEPEIAFGRLHTGENMNPFNIICSFDVRLALCVIFWGEKLTGSCHRPSR